jgi:hypothetical protein
MNTSNYDDANNDIKKPKKEDDEKNEKEELKKT